MKKKTTLIAWIVFLIVLVGIYYGVAKMSAAKEKEPQEEMKEKVVTFSALNVSAVSFSLEDKNYRFVKKEGSWSLDGDDNFEVDGTKMNEAVTALSEMESARTLTDVTDLKEYGLDQPMQIVTLEMKDGKTYVIRFGDINDMTANSYVCLEENTSKVYTVPYSNERKFEGTLEDFRFVEKTSEASEE